MRFTIQFLGLLVIVGCGVWIGRQPTETEPYVTALGALATFLGFFRDRAAPDILLSVRVRDGRPQLFITNRGDADAFEIIVDPGEDGDLKAALSSSEWPLRLDTLHSGQTYTVQGQWISGHRPTSFRWSWARKMGGYRTERQGKVSAEVESLAQSPAPSISSPILDVVSGRGRR